MPAFKDLTGQKFHNLTVIEKDTSPKLPRGRTFWVCLCSCGKFTTVRGSSLTTKNTRSCGCFKAAKATTHGGSKTPEYKTWERIIKRCNNPKDTRFKNYGGRGIRICDVWRNNFAAFLEYVGPKPSGEHSIDRIDNDGDYTPGNVRWSTNTEQANNTSRNHFLTYDGKTMSISQWSRLTGINHGTLITRIRNGWSPERAISQPVKKYKRH